jgi:hypothetical protein
MKVANSMMLRVALATAVLVLAVSVLTASPARAQQARKAPPLPPSSIAQRLQEYQAQRKISRELRKKHRQSRMRRLTGAGQPAGARAVKNDDGGIVSTGTVVQTAIAAGLVITAISAFTNDELQGDGAGGSGGGASGAGASATATSSTTSSN